MTMLFYLLLLPSSPGLMEMRGKLFSSLERTPCEGKQFKCFIFPVLFHLAVFYLLPIASDVL